MLNLLYSLLTDCSYLARIGRLEILWFVNKLASAVTKWTKACDKHFARLISYFHHTCEFRQYFHVENTAQQCKLGLFQDTNFAEDLQDSEINIRRSSVHFRLSHACVNQLNVQETDISLTQLSRNWTCFSGCRFTNGRNSHQTKSTNPKVRSYKETCPFTAHSTWKNLNLTKHVNLDLKNVDHVSSNVRSSRFWCHVKCFWGHWSRD